MNRETDPHKLAHDLLGRDCDDLGSDEQRVLRRVASGSFTGRDADELAQGRESADDRLSDRVAAAGGNWGFIMALRAALMRRAMLNTGALEILRLAHRVEKLADEFRAHVRKAELIPPES